MNQRPSTPWASTWMAMAATIARRSKDPSTRCGSVVVSEDLKTFLGCGFNGPPPLISDHSFDWNNRERKRELVFHAEDNAIWFAANVHGCDKLNGGVLFVNAKPCHRCMLNAVRCQLSQVIYDGEGPQPKMVDDDEFAKTTETAKLGGVNLIDYSQYLFQSNF
jgi:deoxycytidylate deaminase